MKKLYLRALQHRFPIIASIIAFLFGLMVEAFFECKEGHLRRKPDALETVPEFKVD